MKITYRKADLNIDTNKRIYTCSVCSKLFNWNPNSRWYGSYAQMENNPKEILYACSDKCANNLQIN